jgi:hypothetical protein
MKRSRFLIAGMAALALTFALVLAGCSFGSTGSDGTNNSGNTGGGKSVAITGIPQTQWSSMSSTNGVIGLFSPGTTLSQAITAVMGNGSGMVASANLYNDDVKPSGSGPYTVTIPLYSGQSSTRWNGSGTYTVYLLLESGYAYKADSVSFSSATTNIAYNKFLPASY